MKPTTAAAFLASLLCASLAGPAHAQAVYRIVGPDGKVTFSDKPPADEKSKVSTASANANAANTAGGTLPFELRQIVSKYPVVLYTGANCPPCDGGRSLLSSRGIPFSERTITTKEDQDQLRRIAGDASLPYLTIGGQRLRGFSDYEWNQYLDAAGYPKTSQLPASYKRPDPAPLVALQKAAAPASAPKADDKADTAAPAPATPSAPNPNNPAGITF